MRHGALALQSALLKHPIAILREWQAATLNPSSYTDEFLTLCRLLCCVNCPREATQLLKNHRDDSPTARSTKQWTDRQRQFVMGRYDPALLYFNKEPGVLTDYVAAEVSVQARVLILRPALGAIVRTKAQF
jgi:hypothetical protein